MTGFNAKLCCQAARKPQHLLRLYSCGPNRQPGKRASNRVANSNVGSKHPGKLKQFLFAF